MDSFTHGQIIPLEGTAAPFRFQWNPQGIDGPDSKAEWDAIPTAGARIPGVEYSNGGVPNIRFTLALSRMSEDEGYVDDMVTALQKLTQPTVRGRGKDRAPRLKLIMGDRRWNCILLEATPRFEKVFHRTSLKPYFATVSLLFWVIS